MKRYRLKVTILGIPRLYRLIEISGNSTLEDLHDVIFEAFDRYDSHLYSFFITKKDTRNVRTIVNAPEITHPRNTENLMGFDTPKRSAARTRLSDLDLSAKEVFHYLFDFGDDWWHRIRVESVMDAPGKRKFVKMVKAVGQSPEQYPDYDEDDEAEDEYI